MAKRHKVAFGVALATVVALVSWTLVGLIGLHTRKGGGATTTSTAASTRLQGAASTDVDCPTTWEAPLAEPSAPITASYPDPAAGLDVSLYVGTYTQLLGVLAPRGWACASLVDADADGTVALSLGQRPRPSSATWPTPTTRSLIERAYPGTCADCQYELVCPMLSSLGFADLNPERSSSGAPAPCAATLPRGGSVEYIGATPRPHDHAVQLTATFVAPPGDDEDGNWPSSSFETLGAVQASFEGSFSSPHTRILTCQLPPGMRHVCDVAIDYFLSST